MAAQKKKASTKSTTKSNATKKRAKKAVKKAAKKPAKKTGKKAAKKAKRAAAKKTKPAAKNTATSMEPRAPRPQSSQRKLWQKLFIKSGTLLLANAPQEAHAWLDGAPAAVMVNANGDVDTVFGFASDFAELESKVVPALAQAKSVVIVAYQKGSKELHRDTLWEAMKKHGWEGSTLVSVDDTWSAMRCLRAA